MMETETVAEHIRAAYSALHQFLVTKDVEALVLQAGRRFHGRPRDGSSSSTRGRWQLKPDWTIPTPLVDRPRTIAGATSFHFAWTPVAKQGLPTINGRPVDGHFGIVRNGAVDHSRYIERDGAAEISDGANQVASIGCDEAIATVHPRIETVAQAGTPSIFSNISDDPFERHEFWRSVEHCEREPRQHRIVLKPDVAPAWWASLELTRMLPDDFKQHALLVAEVYRQSMAQPLDEGAKRKRFNAKPFPCNSEKAGVIIEAAQNMRGYDDYSPPFEFESGRGGRIQFRIVAELPHELPANDRALIAQNFCDHLATLDERDDEAGERHTTGMMYTAVIHAPDSHNDSRNYHLHAIAYDRPCEYMPERGMWDFEVAEIYDHRGESRVRFPYRQNKISLVSQGTNKSGKKHSGVDFIPTLRAKFAEINNAVLKARGIQRRLDPRKYSEMGIDRTPTEHLGTKAAALESIGVPTTAGHLNALAIWSDAERAIKRQATQAANAYRSTQAELDAVTKRIGNVEPNYPRLNELRAMAVERERLIQDVADDREAIMTFDHLEAKAKSRAVRTRQTCLQLLADIENDKANRSTKMMRIAIEGRWNSAQHHIGSIDRELEPHRPALAKAARDVEAREKRIREIDVALQPLIALVTGRIAHFEKARVAASGPASQQPAAGQSAMAPTPSKGDEREGAEPSNKARQPTEPPNADTPSITTSANEVELRVDPAAPNKAAAAALDQTEQDTFVAIEPPSISGLPIVEPTIAPPPTQTNDPANVEGSTPEGLEPLRPMTLEAPPEPGEPFVISNLDKTDGAAASVEGDSEHAASNGFNANPQSESPTTPGESHATMAQFNEIISNIKHRRVPIQADTQADGTTTYRVTTLNDHERATLEDPRFSPRANQHLESIFSHQQIEIQRAVRWIQTAGQNPAHLNLENRLARISKKATASVRLLFEHWGQHPAVVEAFTAEFDRRIEHEKLVAEQQAAEAKARLDLKNRQREAAKLYPTPDQAFTEEVARFIELLRDGAPPKDLQEAAARIQADPRAREDIQKHNVHLATAYQQHVDEVDPRVIQRIRENRTSGR